MSLYTVSTKVRATAANLRERIGEFLARRVGIDARALATFRISLGFLLLVDLLLRSRDIVAFYTDLGVLPRTVLLERYPLFYRLSIHTISGATWVQAALFLLAAAFAVALLLGYRTTLVTVVSWVLLVSLHARNPIVLNGGDSLLRRLLFWGIFLPLGERWSLDASRGERESSRRRVASAASAALLFQMVFLYTTNAAFKRRADLWARGEAIEYILHLDQFTLLLGDALTRFPTALGYLDRLWALMLGSSILLVLLTGRLRALFASLFVSVHVGMFLSMRLGIFPLISIAGLLPFLPSSVWDAVAARSAILRERLRDGSGSTERRLSTRRLGRPALAHWLGALGRLRRSVTGSRWPAVDLILRLLAVGPARPTTDFRGRSAVTRWKRRLIPLVVVGLLLLAGGWNAAALGYAEPPDGVDNSVDISKHSWDMFANPPRMDVWYAAPGTLESGERIDALHRSAVRTDAPPSVALAPPNTRWRKYLSHLRYSQNADLRERLSEYLCWRWNARHENDLTSITVYTVEQPTRLDGPEQARRVELLEYECSTNATAERIETVPAGRSHNAYI